MLKRLMDIPMSQDPRTPHADITNQPELFGDPEFGDFEEEGDQEQNLYGDFEEGDVDPLAVYQETSGDIEEGDLRSTLTNMKNWATRNKKALAIGGGVAAAGTLAALLLKRRKQAQAKAMVRKSLEQQQYNQTLRQTALVQRSVGKMRLASLMRFFSLKGAKMNSSPIDPLTTFVTDMFKQMLDRQNMDTPFYQETAIGAFAAGTWTATATGVVTDRYYVGLILQIGTNMLNAVPSQIINVTGQFPTINGLLTVAANPWLLTYQKEFDVSFLFYPWQLVSNKPMSVLGRYNNANNIVATITGIPAQSAVNLIVPGSLHPWVVAMRNALIKG